jgi:ubiquitin-protein ligase E3 C
VRYLDLWLRHKLESEIDEDTRWFAQGLTSVVPPGVLNMFTARDLQRLLGGDALDDDSLEDLFRHVRYHAPGGQAGKDRLQAQFEAAMREFAPEERQAMFRFVTSLDRLPPGGCSSLDPPFTVEIDTRARKTSAHFPEAQTCMNHVLAPSYPDAETMMARLRTAAKDGLEYHYEY